VKTLFCLVASILLASPQNAGARRRQSEPTSPPNSTQPIHIADIPRKPLRIAEEIPFRLVSGFLIEVHGEIAGHTGLKFLLDTGSTISLIDSHLADQLHLPAQSAQTLGLSGKARWRQTTVPEVRFGQILAKNVDMMVGDLSAFSAYAVGAHAVIGTDLLKLSNFSIDFDANKIVFQSVPTKYTSRAARLTSAQSVPDQPLSDCVTLDLQIQGHSVKLIVDTGFPGLLLYEQHLHQVIPELRFLGSLKSVIMGESLRGQQGVLPDVLLGAHSEQVTVFVTRDPPAGSMQGIDGVIGLRPLKAHHVHFDFLEKRLNWE
jgi:predicted aspartyl protease